jgi:hypothetical protein
MAIAQYGTSVTGKTSTGYWVTDRYKLTLGSAGTFGYSQSTTTPDCFVASLKVDCEVAQGSLPVGAYHAIEQVLEGLDLQHICKGTASAESLAIQFRVRSNKTGTYIFELIDNDNSRHIASSYTIDSANTWETKTIVFPGDTTGALDKDNNASMRGRWWLAAGTNYTSGTLATSWAAVSDVNSAVGQTNLSDNTANELYITGIQGEPGEHTGPFEHLGTSRYLSLCQRYYITGAQTQAAANSYATTAVANGLYSFPVTMRVAPSTFTISGVGLHGNLGTYSSVSSWGAKVSGISPRFTVTGATAGYPGWSSYTFTASAELT